MIFNIPAESKIGKNIANPSRRAEWLAMIGLLHEATAPGGPLHGYVCHGTSVDRTRTIAIQGLTTTEVLMRDGPEDSNGYPEQRWTDGTYWGIPTVAAFYAEDLIESLENPNLELAIVIARLEDICQEGEMTVDEMTLDSPLSERLDRTEEELWQDWEQSAQSWQDGLTIYGSVVCLAPIGPEYLHILSTPEAVMAFRDQDKEDNGVSLS